MGLDNVRSGSARGRVMTIGAAGAKHTSKTVGLVNTTHVLDDKCHQVALVNLTNTGVVYLSLDGGAAVAASDWPLSSGQVFDVVGGATLNLIADAAGQDVRILESLID